MGCERLSTVSGQSTGQQEHAASEQRLNQRITAEQPDVKLLSSRIEAVLESACLDTPVIAELIAVLSELRGAASPTRAGTRKQVVKVADLYALRFGRDFAAMIEMAFRIEERTTSTSFARAVRRELQRRSARIQPRNL